MTLSPEQRLRALPGDAQSTPERLITEAEMADLLGISGRTLRRMVATGQVRPPATVTYGRRLRRYRPSVVIAQLGRAEWGTNTEDAA